MKTKYKVYDQILTGQTNSNCLQACLATVFQMNMDKVVNVVEETNIVQTWQEALIKWLEPLHIRFTDTLLANCISREDTLYKLGKTRNVNGMIIANVDSPDYANVMHSVIINVDGVCIHDPHPDKPNLGRDLVADHALRNWYELKHKSKLNQDVLKQYQRDGVITHIAFNRKTSECLPVEYNPETGEYDHGIAYLMGPQQNFYIEDINSIVRSFNKETEHS